MALGNPPTDTVRASVVTRFLLVALAAGLLALGALGCGDDETTTAVEATTTTVTETTTAESTTTVAEPARQPLWPGSGYRTATVRKGEKVTVYSDPGKGEIARVSDETDFGSDTVFAVTGRKGRWLRVTTAVSEDNSPAWIEADRRKLSFGTTPLSIHADLAAREVTVKFHDRVVARYTVTIGAEGTGTPTGEFAVTDVIVGGLHPAYGCCALALTAHQTSLAPGWSGGDRIAMHGTVGPVGSASSNGCLRLSDEDADQLAGRARPGTPVFITD